VRRRSDKADLPTPSRAAPTRLPSERRLLGILLMCAAVACFACTDASAKWLNRSVDPILTTWARYVSSMVLVSAVLNPWTVPGLTRTTRPALQGARSVLLLASTAFNFFAVNYLQLTQTIAIQFASPFVIALLAGPLLGEWVGRQRLAAICIGFCGVLIVARPGFGGLPPAAFLSLAGTIAYSLYVIATRMLASHDRSSTTLFYSGLAGVVLVTPVLPFVWSTPTSPTVWIMLGAIGAFAAIGHWLLIIAHALAPAPVLSPFLYTQIIWMGLLGYGLFGDIPDRWTVIGAVLVVASGLYLLVRERRRLPTQPAPEATPELGV
jgi:drug/metabolite transporter (DMT)-like permease